MAEKDLLDPIHEVSVKGFKSFAEEQRIAFAPLTLLAGANSSGKSSALQPLLLLKQSLEEIYDPGPLQLNGGHVQFTSVDQILSRLSGREALDQLEVQVVVGSNFFRDTFQRNGDQLELVRMVQRLPRGQLTLEPGMTSAQIEKVLPMLARVGGEAIWEVRRNRCFLEIVRAGTDDPAIPGIPFTYPFAHALRSIIHVPGLRGNPERTYPATPVGKRFEGAFQNYVAGVVASWQRSKDERLNLLADALKRIGLTWRVEVRSLNATQLELLVGRLKERRRGAEDLVSIADVGFGVSQALPVLVALLAAEPGQLVYIEQPELHLHPRAQYELASVLADAANRGVRVVAETHSSIVLLAVQTLVAERKLSREKVKLHWFQQDSRGATEVRSGDLDQLGAYGSWPEDFGEVMSDSENRYLDAVETRSHQLRKNAKK